MNINDEMLEKCIDWLTDSEDNRSFYEQSTHLIHKEDIENYHRRIYLVTYVDKDKIFNIHLIRVWKYNNETLSLSEDFKQSTDSMEDLPKYISSLITTITDQITY